MNYLKKFNEAEEVNLPKPQLDIDDIKSLFAHSMDNSENVEVDYIYWDKEGEWDYTYDIEDSDIDRPGFLLEYETDNYEEENRQSMEIFEKFTLLINELNDDMFRFKGLNPGCEIEFKIDTANSPMSIGIFIKL